MSVAEALQPYVELIASLIGQHSEVRLAPTGLTAWSAQQQVLQSREAWETAREWIDRVNPRFSFEVADRYTTARAISDAEVAAAQTTKEQVVASMSALLPQGTVACLPTTAGPAPPTGQRSAERTAFRARLSQLTCIAGTIGAPQMNLPLAEVEGMPVGLSLLGNPGDDEMLIAFAREIASALS